MEEKLKNIEISKICESLYKSAETIYEKLKSGAGLEFLDTKNQSHDKQLELDVFADNCFQENVSKNTDVRFILSEERPDLVEYGKGKYSLTLDPLDGSKSALVGIPSGAIFGIFENASKVEDFNGDNIICGGFFVFGINLEVYISINGEASKGVFNKEKNRWNFVSVNKFRSYKMFSINASNRNKWDTWLQKFYDDLLYNNDSSKSYNMRWYASMVSEIKRLIIQGGLFAYPGDSREGYSQGHLRLVYEAMPMSYLIESIGGASTDGKISILKKAVSELHQKTPVFIGERDLIDRINGLNN